MNENQLTYSTKIVAEIADGTALEIFGVVSLRAQGRTRWLKIIVLLCS